jgi:hypothetical protein
VAGRGSGGVALRPAGQQQRELVTLGGCQRGCAGGQFGDPGIQVFVTGVIAGSVVRAIVALAWCRCCRRGRPWRAAGRMGGHLPSGLWVIGGEVIDAVAGVLVGQGL